MISALIGARELHDALKDRGWDHEWRLYPGTHRREYWLEHIEEYLAYYFQALAKGGASARREASA